MKPRMADARSIVRCSDKVFLHHELTNAGLPTPRGVILTAADAVAAAIEALGLRVEDRDSPRLRGSGEVVGVIARRGQIADQEPIEPVDARDRVLAEDDRVEAVARRGAHEGADRARARRRVRLGRGVEDAEPLAPRATPPNFHEPHDRQRPHRLHLSAAHG